MTSTTRRLPGGVLAALVLAGTASGCGSKSDGPNTNTTPTHAFGSHLQMYAPGTARPTGDQNALDEAVKSKYNDWKKYYLASDCGGYYVKVDGVGDAEGVTFVSVSEGHGYGMMLSVLMAGVDPDARKIFDGFLAIRDKLKSPYDPQLMSWGLAKPLPDGGVDGGVDGGAAAAPAETEVCTGPPPSDNDAATDGDMDAAFALLLAEQQWKDPYYGRRAKDVIEAIKLHEMHPTTKLPLLGDWSQPTDLDLDAYTTTRLSDHMPDHFRAFAKATKDPFWDEATAAVYKLIGDMQVTYAPDTGLVPDFVKKTTTVPIPVPVAEADNPDYLGEDLTTDFDYNACRVPWRLGTDYLITGDATAKGILAKFNAFIQKKTAGDPAMIIDGYSLAGVPHPMDAGPNGCFTGGFGVSALSEQTNQTWADAIWKNLSNGSNDDYYGDTIRLINMIVMSGNWWTP